MTTDPSFARGFERFDLVGGALITMFSASCSLGFAKVCSKNLTENLMETAIEELLAQFPNRTDLVVKIVGPEALVALLQEKLHQNGVLASRKKVTERENLTGFFSPTTGEIRVGSFKTRVAIVDDSKVIRGLLRKILESDPDIEVVADFESPSEALSRIWEFKPDVVTLDIHMPEMDGVSLLEKLLERAPIPALMVTALSRGEGTQVFRALEAGAVDYVQKPSFDELDRIAPTFIEKVKLAANTKVNVRRRANSSVPLVSLGERFKVIGFGASTGGTDALSRVLSRFSEEIPAILIVQHIPPVFSTSFANRLKEICPFEVKEATDGDEVLAGRALLAPGGAQMELVLAATGGWTVRVFDGPPGICHRPSVDILFRSIASIAGKHACGVLLTGMGNDGAAGLLQMKEAGAITYAQDEKSSAVWGMPKTAIEIGAVTEVLALEEIADKLNKASQCRLGASRRGPSGTRRIRKVGGEE